MEPLVEAGLLQGKLCCPQCNSRFGNFNWAGQQCSCGCWVTPAFQINLSRIDCMPPPPSVRVVPGAPAARVSSEADNVRPSGIIVDVEEVPLDAAAAPAAAPAE